MKAAICYEFGKSLVVEEIDIDPPQAGEVKVRLAATAICHSDVHVVQGEWGAELPVVAGHEAAGVVEEIGDGVTLARPGDRVVVSMLRSCGRCFFCATGFPYLCDGRFALGSESRLRNRRGQALHQGLRTAAFAEYTVVHESQVIQVPDDLPFDRACLLACGVITGAGSVINTARVPVGSSVAVIGIGGVGLNVVQGAVLSGAQPIIAVDLLENKLDAARAFGASHTVDAGSQNPVAVAWALTGGRGVDYAFVAVGNTAVVTQAFDMTRKGGTTVVVGMPSADATANLLIHQLIDERKVMGSPLGSTRLRVDVPRLVEFYRQGRLKLDELITARYALEEINDAIASMQQGAALRNVIVF